MTELLTKGAGRSWAVYRGHQRISRYYTNNFDAKNAAHRLEISSRTRPRKCLCCGTEFNSTGAGHRMCNDCRQLTAGMD